MPSDIEVANRALQYLERHHCMSIATDGPCGLWAATVFYVNDSFVLHFLSLSNTRHALNIEENPRVAATIGDDAEDWTQVSGIQFEGSVARVDDSAEHDAVMAAFVRRYPFADSMWWWSGTVLAPGVKQLVYRVEPESFFYVDHTFGDVRFEIAAGRLGESETESLSR
jgi:uncharacterized protein YhbP (UPF0306 family)